MMKNISILIFIISCLTLIGQTNSQTIDNGIDFYHDDPDIYVTQLLVEAKTKLAHNTEISFAYLNDALKEESKIHDSTKIHLYSVAGEIYFNLASYHIALDYFFKELRYQNELDSLLIFRVYNSIGNVYYIMKDIKKARIYYTKAQSIIESESYISKYEYSNVSTVYNNLAVIERKEQNYIKAQKLLLKNLKIAQQNNDTTYIINSYHNLANVSVDLGDIDKGMHYIDIAFNLCELTNSDRDRSFLLVNKGIMLKDEYNNLDSALIVLLEAYDISEAKNYPYVQKESATQLVDIYKSIGDYQQALFFNEIEQELSENAINSENIKEITRIELNSKHEKAKLQLIAKQHKKELLYIFGIIILMIILIIFFLLIRLQKKKAIERKLKNEVLESKLKSKNKELTSNVLHMLQVAEIIDDTGQRISDIRRNASEEIKKELSSVMFDLSQDRRGLNWDEFEKLFVETHQGFYKRLLLDFSDLTKNEVRLCAFLKMNLSTKEISAITGQSDRSIVMARSRLRKKIGINNEQKSFALFFAQY